MKRLDALWALLAGIAAWQALVMITGAPHFILPSPLRVASTAIKSYEIILSNAWVTALEVVLGLVLGTALGVATAIHLTTSALARRIMLPMLVFTQAVPVFALAPILTLWFGYGIGSKVIMAVLIIYYPSRPRFMTGCRAHPPHCLIWPKPWALHHANHCGGYASHTPCPALEPV